MAIGSFSQVAGQSRVQIAILDLIDYPADGLAVADDHCSRSSTPTARRRGAPLVLTYMRDIDISPDGSYFVVVTTGAFRANRLCDSINRLELTTTGPNQAPTWTDWTGGDTSWSVSVSGTAVYVGGHMRWMNNSYRGDVAGPGAVPRRASPRSRRSTASPSRGTPATSGGSGASRCRSRPTGSGSGATRITPATSSTRRSRSSRPRVV